ncbi:MAG: TonB family protein [Cyanobacteria bacterium P01_G01_bin.67]
MREFLVKQQQSNNNLLLGLCGSILIHGLVAFLLSRQQSPPSPQVNKPIEIIVVEPSAAVSKSDQLTPTEAESQPALPSPQPVPQTNAETQSETIAPPVNQPPAVISKSVTPSKIAAQPSTPALTESDIIKPPQTSNTLLVTPKDSGQKIEPENKPESKNRQQDNSKPELIPPKNPSLLETANSPTPPEATRDHLIKPDKPKPIPPLNKPAKANSVTELEPISDRPTESNLEPKLPEQPTKPNATTALGDRSRRIKPQPSANANSVTEDSNNSSNNSPPAKPNNSHNQEQNSVAANTNFQETPKPLSVSCEKNCQPEYPDILDGTEGSAGIQITIDKSGKVIDAAIAVTNGNPQLDQEALKAAQSMEFSSIDRDLATIRINISFTVAGSDFEKHARQEQKEREKREKQRQEELEKARQLESNS